MLSDLDRIEQLLHDMADERGELAMTSNTRSLIEEAESLGLVKAVSGKFKALEPGHLNSVYRIL